MLFGWALNCGNRIAANYEPAEMLSGTQDTKLEQYHD